MTDEPDTDDDTTEGPLHDYREARDTDMNDPTTEPRDDEPTRGEKPPNPEHVRAAKMHEASKHHPDVDAIPFKIGDPVMDAAQGRPMVVLDVPPQTVAEWSEANNYDLTENYGNQKSGVDEREPVYVCRYVSDVSGDPKKTYTFPQSRLRLIDAHHADDGRRIYDRVAVDVLAELFREVSAVDGPIDSIQTVAANATSEDVASVARELADVDATIGGDHED